MGGGAFLRRFEVTALRTTSALDTTRIPIPQAQVDFYLQGATISGSTISIGSGSSGTVTVEDTGSLAIGDSVRLGLGGVSLTVTAVGSATQVTLSNSSGITAVLDSGTRLINLSRRPTVYQDQLGAVALTPPILTDTGGRATVYLPSGFYDYVVTGDIVTLDACSVSSGPFSTNTYSWSHTASGDNRIVVVAIAWQESLASETLDSVTYGGLPMTRISSDLLLDLFALVNPPTGSKTIQATWSGSGTKAVIGGAASFNNVDPDTPYPSLIRAASNNDASPTITLVRTQPNSLFQDCLAVDTVPASATASVGTGQTSLWNATAGSVPSTTRTLGASSYAKKDTDSVTLSWSLSHADLWKLRVVELFPTGIRLFTDEQGEVCPAVPFALSAADFTSLQEAIDALPDSGGTLLVPPGTYALETSLIVNKTSVTIVGAGQSTRIVPADPVHNPIDLIRVSAGLVRISNLLLDGLAEDQDLETGTCCIVFEGLGVSGRLVLHSFLENVVAQRASKAGIWLRSTILFTAINCEAIFNLGDGVRIQGTATPLEPTTTINFTNCSMSQNGGIGANVGDSEVGTVGINFLGCTFENNQGIGYTLADIGTGVYALVCAKIALYSCYFELAPEGCEQFVFFDTAPNAVVDNCWFHGSGNAARAVLYADSYFARFTSNTAEAFTDEIVKFDTSCVNCVEFANRDMNSALPRMVFDGNATVVGMSRNTISLPRVALDGNRPSGSEVKEGSLIWVSSPTGTSKLQIWDGSTWKSIALT